MVDIVYIVAQSKQDNETNTPYTIMHEYTQSMLEGSMCNHLEWYSKTVGDCDSVFKKIFSAFAIVDSNRK